MLSLAILNAPVRLFTVESVGRLQPPRSSWRTTCRACGARWLAREVTGSETAAFWGGIFWGFLFFRVHHIGHLQILSCQAIPAAAAAAAAVLEEARRRDPALLFAVLFVAQALVSWYLAFITAVILAGDRALPAVAGSARAGAR